MVPSEVSIFWVSVFPNPCFVVKKIKVAPHVAAVTFKKAPNPNPNKNPPVKEAIGEPGKAKVTKTMYEMKKISAEIQ
tara:strand:- start:1099 stop:1329 length:231 start_codon:yes stop_codon:yes gene_type:complete